MSVAPTSPRHRCCAGASFVANAPTKHATRRRSARVNARPSRAVAIASTSTGILGSLGDVRIPLTNKMTVIDAYRSALNRWKAYCASKGAVLNLTRSIAVECAQLKLGIRCNSVLPGLTQSDMADSFLKNFASLGLFETVAQSEAAFLASVPNGKWGYPQDIAGAIVYLAAGVSRHMTGAQIVVDGGFAAV